MWAVRPRSTCSYNERTVAFNRILLAAGGELTSWSSNTILYFNSGSSTAQVARNYYYREGWFFYISRLILDMEQNIRSRLQCNINVAMLLVVLIFTITGEIASILCYSVCYSVVQQEQKLFALIETSD